MVSCRENTLARIQTRNAITQECFYYSQHIHIHTHTHTHRRNASFEPTSYIQYVY